MIIGAATLIAGGVGFRLTPRLATARRPRRLTAAATAQHSGGPGTQQASRARSVAPGSDMAGSSCSPSGAGSRRGVLDDEDDGQQGHEQRDEGCGGYGRTSRPRAPSGRGWRGRRGSGPRSRGRRSWHTPVGRASWRSPPPSGERPRSSKSFPGLGDARLRPGRHRRRFHCARCRRRGSAGPRTRAPSASYQAPPGTGAILPTRSARPTARPRPAPDPRESEPHRGAYGANDGVCPRMPCGPGHQPPPATARARPVRVVSPPHPPSTDPPNPATLVPT